MPEKTSAPESLPENKLAKIMKIKAIKITAAVFVIFVIGGLSVSSFYFYQQYKKTSAKQAQTDTRDELTKLTDEIKSFMLLPDEVPTLATVTDVEQAKSQPFFAKALNGDKVLIYINAKKAILYRPSEKKIIEVANVSGLESGQDSSAGTLVSGQNENSTPTENPENAKENEKEIAPKIVKVAVYNGSNIKGLAAALASKISAVDKVKITEKVNAKGSYDTTFVIDLTGENAAMCEKIARAIGGQVGVFPEDEKMPQDADVLVIGGSQ